MRASNSFRAEITRTWRFGIVGSIATMVHLLVAFIFSSMGLSPYLCHLCGYLCAFSISFLGQHFWTFQPSRRLAATIWRFALVSLAAYGASNLLLWMGRTESLPVLVSLLVAGLSVPLISYLIGRFWVFR